MVPIATPSGRGRAKGYWSLKPSLALSRIFFFSLSLFIYFFLLNLRYLITLLGLALRIQLEMGTWDIFLTLRKKDLLFLFFFFHLYF